MLKYWPFLKSTLSNGFRVNRTQYSSRDCSMPIGIGKTNVKSTYHIQSECDRKFVEGKHYDGFECVRSENIPDFGIMSYTFRHLITGTELWYIDRADTNNVFSVNFRTTPLDSTGLPHILEHSVLCGSEKYPVRDPFFKMLNRSMATFMNAMTGPDYTMYPFSTMNEIDFRNLQKIYLDAVFRPNLEYLDFLQEGWRLEHSNPHDKNSEYIIKGVVYNEMKGAFSENSSVFAQNLLNNLLPDHTYGHVSGGNPLEIPKLTHENLIEFHRKYYHPSNARIYTYGTFDLRKTLSYINDEYLSHYKAIENSYSCIPNQERWSKPRHVHISSRFDNMGAPFEKQNQIAIAMLMCDITDIQESFVLYVLYDLLVRGPNSYFYRSLIEPNFSGGYNQTTTFDTNIKDTFFCVGLQDLQVEDFTRVQELFESTIKEAITKGFDFQHIESILHNIELSLKHQSPRFGMSLLFNSTPLWNHEGDVVKSLHVTKMIANFRAQLQGDPSFLQKKVSQYFLNNSHKLILTMSPDDTYEENFHAAELNLLKQKIIVLDEEKRNEIYENGLKLEAAQKAIPDIDKLPCLSLTDVMEAPKLQPFDLTDLGGVQTQICKVHTNGITYFKCYFDGTSLTEEEILQIPIFCNIINDMGTKKYDYRQFDKIVLSKTGGIDFKLHFTENIHHGKTFHLGIFMTTHALDKNVHDMFNLCHELLINFKIDDADRAKMLIDNYLSNISVGIANSGHIYAMQSCAGLINNSAKLKSLLAGIEHIEYVKQYLRNNSIHQVMDNIKALGSKLFNKDNMRTAVNTSNEFCPFFVENYKEFLYNLPNNPNSQIVEKKIELLEPSCQHIVLNVPVNYCAKTLLTVPYIHVHHPALRVLAKYITSKYLLPVIREQNGAYGAGAKIGADGIFGFYSYRDPNSIKTLQAFDDVYQWLQDNKSQLNEQALFEAKLGVLQQLDSPVAPGNWGIDFFLYGVSHEIFLQYRSRILNVTIHDLKEVADTYFKSPSNHMGKCILGPENKNLEEKTQHKWNIIV